MRHLRALEHGVDGHVHQPRARQGERHQAGGARLGQPARDAVAGGEPLPGKPMRQPADRRLEPRIVERASRDLPARPPPAPPCRAACRSDAGRGSSGTMTQHSLGSGTRQVLREPKSPQGIWVAIRKVAQCRECRPRGAARRAGIERGARRRLHCRYAAVRFAARARFARGRRRADRDRGSPRHPDRGRRSRWRDARDVRGR